MGSRLLPFLLVLGTVGCGSRVAADEALTGGGGEGGAGGSSGEFAPPCPTFQERTAGGCRPVEVRDVREESVWFESGGYSLPGTLTLPVTDGIYLATGAVILHGTGPGPRDGTSSQNLGFIYPKPVNTYENLAENLARAGLAVLRYDKRSCFEEIVHACKNSSADYPGDIDAIVLDDFVADARAAARFVADRPDVRDRDIVALGHSEGGVLVTALLDEPVIGSAVLLGAPSMPFEVTAPGQLEIYADYLAGQGSQYELQVDALRDKAALWREELGQIRDGTYSQTSWEGASLPYVRSTLSWYDSLEQRFLDADQRMLVLAGGSDFNVWPEHFERYRALSEEQLKTNVTLELLPDVTHALCVKPEPDPWAFDPALAPSARDALVAWVGGSESGLMAP